MVFIAIGGGLGALGRYIVGNALNKSKSYLPWGTWLVNILGSFILGVIVGSHIEEVTYAFIGIGFLGGFTTFSTFMVESIQLWKKNKINFVIYVLTTYLLGIMFAIFGLIIGRGTI
ncbi:fluoride efflux transporter CrcB [Bacillus sp. 2205SS5-2]|uniref:fluoride efflux transporter CrcB n=1 Tax=Bacillus sp. 2205SS5-2 TaxID=3109031 RepID=UPI0030072D7C